MNAPAVEWRQTFPGTAQQVARVRRFVALHLGDRREVDTAQLIVSELSANAVRHTNSGEPGGRFSVTLRIEGDELWMGVLDEGGRAEPEVCKADERAEGGRGLDLVDHLAETWGVHGDERSRTVWATVALSPRLPCS
ncbi:ATP-binding protein [Herbidospora sp. RD11066]